MSGGGTRAKCPSPPHRPTILHARCRIRDPEPLARSAPQEDNRPPISAGTADMIITDNGLRLQRTGNRWRCVEYPAITMDAGGRFRIDGREGEFDSIQDAIDAMMKGPTDPSPDAEAP